MLNNILMSSTFPLVQAANPSRQYSCGANELLTFFPFTEALRLLLSITNGAKDKRKYLRAESARSTSLVLLFIPALEKRC